MTNFETFAPTHLSEGARGSGFFQCKECGLIWFAGIEQAWCPVATAHGKPVHVAVLCRACDEMVSIEQIANHLSSESHKVSAKGIAEQMRD
jgi:hypothetical protein